MLPSLVVDRGAQNISFCPKSKNQDYCDSIPSIIVPPALADNAGIMGALALASTAAGATLAKNPLEVE